MKIRSIFERVFLNAQQKKTDTTRAHLFPRRVPSVKAPIITDATVQKGVQPLLDMVAALESYSNLEVAVAESARLENYFSALSVYLTEALAGSDQEASLRGFATPGALRDIFNKMAAATHNTMISEVAILPSNIGHPGMPASHLFKNDEFNTRYS